MINNTLGGLKLIFAFKLNEEFTSIISEIYPIRINESNAINTCISSTNIYL